MKYPIALPWLATGDIGTAVPGRAELPGHRLRRPGHQEGRTSTRPESKQGAGGDEVACCPTWTRRSRPSTSPRCSSRCTTAPPRWRIMFSGRMNDLTQPDEHQVLRQVRLRRAARGARGRQDLFGRLSVDGWSIPYNTKVDKDLLFEVIAASVSEDASKASIPAAYPARKGLRPERIAVRQGRRRGDRQPERAGGPAVATADQQRHPAHHHRGDHGQDLSRGRAAADAGGGREGAR